jgi:hypothetical protein
MQIDAVGNVSDLSKITSPIIVDTTDPILDQQQPITANISPNTPITTTVYDAQVTNLNGGTVDEGITYSIEGTNTDKFSITTDTGILTYKTIQTSVHVTNPLVSIADRSIAVPSVLPKMT